MAHRCVTSGAHVCCEWLTCVLGVAHKCAGSGSQVCCEWFTGVPPVAHMCAASGSQVRCEKKTILFCLTCIIIYINLCTYTHTLHLTMNDAGSVL